MPPLMSSVKQTLSEAASRAAGVSCMYKLAGVEAVGGDAGELRHSDVGQAAANRTGHLSLATQLAFSSDQRCYEVKERRGEQPSPHAAAVAFVTFGFGSAENVLSRSLRPSETDDVWPAATELCISCPSVRLSCSMCKHRKLLPLFH